MAHHMPDCSVAKISQAHIPIPREGNAMSATSWFSKITGTALRLDNLQDLLVEQLKDLASAEEQLIAALPKMAAAAHCQHLKQAFENHLQETKGQKARIEQAFRAMGHEPETETCEAMQGLIAEGQEIIDMDGDADVKDAGLIAAAQRVEHYEIAGYGCARSFARRLGLENVAQLLQQTLDEERHADEKLTQLGETAINARADK
jgi:ferritin-like metal-binding protein YciE